jgi:hypothetical protein
MAKKKQSEEIEDNVSEGSVDMAGSNQTGSEKVRFDPPSITGELEALTFVRENYIVPEGCRLVVVTEDKNVFWQENASSAANHAQKNNLKIFRLPWQV